MEELNREFTRNFESTGTASGRAVEPTVAIVDKPAGLDDEHRRQVVTAQMPEERPKVRAVSYGLIQSKGFHGLLITNDGEPAYAVSIPRIQIGTAVLNIECDVPRLTHNRGDIPCQAWIEKSPHDFEMGSGLFELLRKQSIAGIDLPIHYRDDENRWYRTLSRIERNVKASGGLEVRFVRQESLDLRSLPPVARSEPTPSSMSKPNLQMIGYQYPRLKTDANDLWRMSWDGQKSLLFTFVNNPDKNGNGVDASGVRAQLTFEWDTGAVGPHFSPLPWLDEEFSFVDIPLGVEKKLVVGQGLAPQRGWYGCKYKRTNANWQKGVSPLESNPIPDRGKMKLRLFASIGGKSEAIWMACFSWRVEFDSNHPWFEQIDCRDLKGLAEAGY